MNEFQVRGFNPCESLLRHKPEQLRAFIRRMKTYHFNTLIIHSDYGWRRYQDLITEECLNAGVEITLMVFGPRTFYSLTDWKSSWFAKDENGKPFTERPECETHPCASNPESLQAFQDGAEKYIASLPHSLKRLHMRAGDGFMFCRCEKCRRIPEHEQYYPFVKVFIQAAKKVRPDLKLETDLYIKRYFMPSDIEPYKELDRLMFDTFYRHPFYPIGSKKDQCNRFVMQYAAPEGWADTDTPNEFYLKRLREWSDIFPGKVYIHENAMMQSYYGTFQHGTDSYLKDLNFYRNLGLQGICYEAFEPGFVNFEKSFEILARAMNGETITYEMTELEQYLRKHPQPVFCYEQDFPLEKFFRDPFLLEQNRLYRELMLKPSLDHFRRYLKFAFDNEERMDPLYIGYGTAKNCLAEGVAVFPDISAAAQDFLSRRKLWDFMEDIPDSEDPRKVCKNIIFELMEKGRKVNG